MNYYTVKVRAMKVSGFTVIRNAQIMGYPILQSLRSLLPLVDEIVVGLGQSTDNTQKLIESLNDPKIFSVILKRVSQEVKQRIVIYRHQR